MDIYVLNTSYEVIGIVDYFESCIWTNRYCAVGDFELYLPVTDNALSLLKIGNWLVRDDNRKNLMLISSVKINTDEEGVEHITVTGSSAEILLDRRIIWSQTNLNDTVTNCVKQLVNDNLINPSNANRKITDVVIGDIATSTTNLTKQITYDNLLDAVIEILSEYKLGFNFTFEYNKFHFNVYNGLDRTENQNDNLRVVFSTDFDNLITSDFTEDASTYKNVALVAGEGEGVERKTYATGTATGINRKELYVDARDISSDTEDGYLTDAEYNKLLNAKGKEALNDNAKKHLFEATIDPTVQYSYKVDYDLGDVIQIKNEFGISADTRIIEVIESYSDNGYTLVPTLENFEEVTQPVATVNSINTESNNMLLTESASILSLESDVSGECVKISELPNASSITNNDLLVSVISNVTKKITYETVKNNILDTVYPIDSIYMSVNNTNPANFFGGTWVSWGSGRVPVGVDENNTNFNSSEKTGGNTTTTVNLFGDTETHTLRLEEIPEHNHGSKSLKGTFRTYKYKTGWDPSGIVSVDTSSNTNAMSSGTNLGGTTYNIDASHTHNSVGGGQGHSHSIDLTTNASTLQPYITCYMWKRTV